MQKSREHLSVFQIFQKGSVEFQKGSVEFQKGSVEFQKGSVEFQKGSVEYSIFHITPSENKQMVIEHYKLMNLSDDIISLEFD